MDSGDDAPVRIPRDTDVVLLVGNRCFYSNRGRLAQRSHYFEAMFNSRMIESKSDLIELKGVSPRSMKTLVDFVNTNSIPNVADDVQQLLEAAIMYQFDVVMDKCVEYLQSTCNIDTCLGIMYLSDRFGLSALHLQAKQFALWNFDLVASASEFLDLHRDTLMEYLSHDDLHVPSEMAVFRSLVRWASHDTETRLHLFNEELIAVVRFSEVCLQDLKIVSHEQLVQRSPWLHRIIHEIWKIKFKHYQEQRALNGASTPSITPLSSISPAESLQSLEGQLAEEVPVAKDDKRIGSDMVDGCLSEHPLSRLNQMDDLLDIMPVEPDGGAVLIEDVPVKDTLCFPVTGAIKLERVIALRLLTAGPRFVPIFPAVVLHNEDEPSKPPTLICYDFDKHSIVELGTMTKAIQNNRVAFGFTACAVGNFVYIVGGEFMFGHGNWNNSVWRFNTFTRTWSFLVNLRQPRRHHAVCVMDNYLYLIGGTTRFRVVTNNVEKLHLPTGNWSDVASLPVTVHSAACTVHQGKIYVMEANVYRYDAHMDMWSELGMSRLLSTVGVHAAMPHSTGIYLIGRNNGELIRCLPDNSFSNPDRCHTVGKFANPTENACIVGNKIYSFARNEFLIVESYDIDSNTFAVEFSCNDRKYPGATYSPGCFTLPKYS